VFCYFGDTALYRYKNKITPSLFRISGFALVGMLVTGFSEPAMRPAEGIQLILAEQPAMPTPVRLELGEGLPAISKPTISLAERSRRMYRSADTRFAWRGIFNVVDGGLWTGDRADTTISAAEDYFPMTLGRLEGVGFPHIDASIPRSKRYQAFARMVSWREVPNAYKYQPIAHVRCMGLSPERVAKRADAYDVLILELATEYGISVSLVKAVITVESCFNAKAESGVGAYGLMQLMPATAKWLEAGDTRIPKKNLRAGIRYLALLQRSFGDVEIALAAYNAGPGAVKRYGGVPPYKETQRYVRMVMTNYRRYVAATRLAGI